MTKEILIQRLRELQQLIANAEAQAHRMRGQETELLFWINQFELAELEAAKAQNSLSIVKPAEGSV